MVEKREANFYRVLFLALFFYFFFLGGVCF